MDEKIIRLSISLGLLIFFAILESLIPRRVRTLPRLKRWWTNLSLVAVDTFLLRLLFPGAAVGFSILITQKGWGLFNNVNLPITLEIILGIILLDFSIYLQHILSHRFSLLWRLHRVHHADPDLDVTSGSRFHPLEIICSMLYKYFWIMVLGPSAGAVVIFEVLLNGLALFNHANLSIPLGIDKFIRFFIVTPEMHRIHHSTIPSEHHSNYGFNLSIWDRIFKTYTEKASLPQDKMNLGLSDIKDPKRSSTLFGVLIIPFQKSQTK
ncbi:MAG: sterol desaturase family protein [Bacteriovoracaceae bacterium]|nr:sterol desaturase family protein [Bacteriovoracaceae bacterium]